MKKSLFLVFCTCIAFSAQAKVKVFDPQPRVLAMHELSLEKIQEFIHARNSEFAVELREGIAVPLQFLMKSPLLSAVIDPNMVVRIEKTCYLTVVNKKCYMSEDLVHWEKVSKFIDGNPIIEIRPNKERSGLILETTFVPDLEENEEEE